MRSPALALALAIATLASGCSKKEEPPPPPPPVAPAPAAPAPAAPAGGANASAMKTESAPAPAKCPPDTQVEDACIKLPAGWKMSDSPRKPGEPAYFSDGHNANGSVTFQAPGRFDEFRKANDYLLTIPKNTFSATGPTAGGKGKFYVFRNSDNLHKVEATIAGSKHAVTCSTGGQGTLPPEALAICKSISVN